MQTYCTYSQSGGETAVVDMKCAIVYEVKYVLPVTLLESVSQQCL